MDTLPTDLIRVIDGFLNITEAIGLNIVDGSADNYADKLLLKSKLKEALELKDHNWILYLAPHVRDRVYKVEAIIQGYAVDERLKWFVLYSNLGQLEKQLTKAPVKIRNKYIRNISFACGQNNNDLDMKISHSKVAKIFYIRGLASVKNIEMFDKLWSPSKDPFAIFLLNNEQLILDRLTDYVQNTIIQSANPSLPYDMLDTAYINSYNHLLEKLILILSQSNHLIDVFIILVFMNRFDLVKKYYDIFDPIHLRRVDMLESNKMGRIRLTNHRIYNSLVYHCFVKHRDIEVMEFIKNHSIYDYDNLHLEFWQPDEVPTADNFWSYIEVMCRTNKSGKARFIGEKIKIENNQKSIDLVAQILLDYDSVQYVKNVIEMIDELETLKTFIRTLALYRAPCENYLKRVGKYIGKTIEQSFESFVLPGTFESILWNYTNMNIIELKQQCIDFNINVNDSLSQMELIKLLMNKVL